MSKVSLVKQLHVVVAGVVIVVLGTTHVRSASPSVVTVSLMRVATVSNAGKRANQTLETLKQERGRDLLAKQRALEDVVRQLAKADALPQTDRDRLTQDQNRLRTELQQLTAQANSDFQAMQLRLNSELRGQVAPILADIAKRSGVDVVLNLDNIAWAAPGTDTTDEVIQRLNALPQ